MSIIFQLSSQLKERGEQGNRRVVELILQNPSLYIEIINNLNTKNPALLGDCVEVCAMLAENDPDLVAPFAQIIIPLIYHKNSKVRWEAMHTIALITPKTPDLIFQIWDYLAQLFLEDKSVIVRDYIVVCAGNLAACGGPYIKVIYPFLVDALNAHNTHHAKLALEGIIKALPYLIDHLEGLEGVVEVFIQHPKPSIKKSAQKLKNKISSLQV